MMPLIASSPNILFRWSLELRALICCYHFNNPTRAGIYVEIPGAAQAGVTVAYSISWYPTFITLRHHCFWNWVVGHESVNVGRKIYLWDRCYPRRYARVGRFPLDRLCGHWKHLSVDQSQRQRRLFTLENRFEAGGKGWGFIKIWAGRRIINECSSLLFYSQNPHHPQNHADFNKRGQIHEIIWLCDFRIKLRNKRIKRII